MPTSFPIYSHPLRAKVVMVKGAKGDTPTASITKDDQGEVTITITNPNDGHPITDTVKIRTPSVTAEQTETGATITVTDEFGTTVAELTNGEDGQPGPAGVSIVSARISSNNHLVITMSDGTEVDTGEIPVGALEVVDTITLDGTTKTYTMTADVPQDDVAYILINGLVNTDGFTISNTTPRTITLNMETVPNGTLEIVQNTSGYIGERMEALSDAEIIEIMGGTGSE